LKPTTTEALSGNGSLPKGWRMVRFDELAQMVNERVDPSATDAEIYVGLEHLDPDSLKLRRWGTPSDVIGDKLQFRKGDIIFGRRRAYQRKLAVAEFDGICSAHAMVVRSNTKTVEPDFLPFLMQSDLFMQRAIDISVGSLSPTINWKTLRIQEFPLPPKDEQRRIAEILWAAEEVIESWTRAIEHFAALLDAISLHEFSSRVTDVTVISPVDLCESVTVGIVVTPAKWYCDHGIPAIRSLNVFPDRFVLDDLVRLTEVGHASHRKSELRKGDVVIVRTGRPGDAAVVNEDVHGFNAIDLIIARPLPKLDPHFLSRFLNSASGRLQLRRGTAGSAQQHFNVGEMKHLRIPVRSLDEQAETVARMRAIETRLQDALDIRDCVRRMAAILRDSLLCNKSEESAIVH
jgi:type I restriction enzyme S subunit